MYYGFRLRNSGRPWQRRRGPHGWDRVHEGGRVLVYHRILPGRRGVRHVQEWRHVEWDASNVQR